RHWDLLTRKLQVGAFIRTGGPGPEATKHTENLRERLEELRDALLAGNLSEARERLAAGGGAGRGGRRADPPRAGASAAGGRPEGGDGRSLRACRLSRVPWTTTSA